MNAPRRIVAKQIGELLVECGVITADQLNEAVAIQQQRGGLLGQVLVRLGYADEEAVAQALTTQYGFPYLPLQNYTMSHEVVRLIPEQVARQYCLIAVDRMADVLTIVMADPLNTKAVEDVEAITHCTVQVFVSTLSAVTNALETCYGGTG